MSAQAAADVPSAAAPPVDLAAREARLQRIYGATGATALLSFASFHPVDLGILAWVALVPVLYLAATEGRRVAVASSYFATVLFHVVGLSWIALTTPEGWLLTSFLEGFYGVALICLPLWLRRRTGLPLFVGLPVLGIALECMRANFPFIAFPWLLWGHTQHARNLLIQIADVGSVYALSGLVLCVNGAIVDAALRIKTGWDEGRDPTHADRRFLHLVVAVPVALIGLTLVYGLARRAHVRSAMEDHPGPRLLVVQVDIPQNLKDGGLPAEQVALENLRLTEAALRREREPVDAVVWSETMWPYPIREERPGAKNGWNQWADGYRKHRDVRYRAWFRRVESLDRRLRQVPIQANAPLLVGGVDKGWDGPPHNSYYMLAPDPPRSSKVVARYDKINLVPVSEYIPGRKGSLFFDLMKSFVPPGFTVFARGRSDRDLFEVGEHLLAPNICFEISFPELLRTFTARGATVHVCPANDAWFVRGERGEMAIATAEVELARAHTRFRAVENRRGVVRCVNRGVSLVMGPDGTERERVHMIGDDAEPREVGVANSMIVRAPTTDLRSFYVRFGNVLPALCALLSVAALVLAWKGHRLLGDPEE